MANLAEVLAWKYGHVAGTRQVDPSDTSSNPEMEISSWNHPTKTKPSKVQIGKDFVAYEAYLAGETQKRVGRENAEQTYKESTKDKTAAELTEEDIEQFRRIQIAKEYNLAME